MANNTFTGPFLPYIVCFGIFLQRSTTYNLWTLGMTKILEYLVKRGYNFNKNDRVILFLVSIEPKASAAKQHLDQFNEEATSLMTDENKPKLKAKKRLIILSSVFILAILAFVIGAYLENQNKTQERGVIQEDIGVLKRVTYQGKEYIEKTAVTTILLMGVDQNDDEERYTARQGGQADFIMLYVIDHNDRTISQLQIDRDTMANVKVYGIFGNDLGTRMMQICLAHGYGTTDEEKQPKRRGCSATPSTGHYG